MLAISLTEMVVLPDALNALKLSDPNPRLPRETKDPVEAEADSTHAGPPVAEVGD